MTLYERIGGEAAVSRMINPFYSRVLADVHLRPFFEHTTVDRLIRMQKEFFAVALDGPGYISDFDLAKAHQGTGIRREHLTRFADHLIAALANQHSIERRDAMEIMYRIGTYSDQVLGESGGADG